MSFLLALINDHRVSAGDKIADIIGPGPKQLRHAGSLRQNEHACILDGRGLGHCWVIVVYVLGSGATLELADARGYRCRNKGNVVVRCGDYRPVRAKDGRWVFRSSRFVPRGSSCFLEGLKCSVRP